jgi:HEXXH motif-containing protein
VIPKHRLTGAEFEALAAGEGDPEVIRLLRNAERSRHLLRLRALCDAQEFTGSTALDLLTRLQSLAPDAVEEVLFYPHVHAWSAGCLEHVAGSSKNTGVATPDPAHLAAVAAVAAVRSGRDISVSVPVRHGIVALPSLGSATPGPESLNGSAMLRIRDGTIEITTADKTVLVVGDPEQNGPSWHGLRRLRAMHAGHRLELYLDDLDPFRDRHGLGAAPRLDALEVAAWERTLNDAWTILMDNHAKQAEAIAAGLTTIVPLADRGRRGLSATAIDAPGSVAMTRPGDGLLLAEGLVHELQHAKLGALLGLAPLYQAQAGEHYYAPWRDDPRPVGGLLQGAYAYLGVTKFWWRQSRASSGAEADFAQFQFTLWREETWKTTGVLNDSKHLTELGHRFVSGMRAALERLRRITVSTSAAVLADDAAADHAITWRLRHVRPDERQVDRMARACPLPSRPSDPSAGRTRSAPAPDGSQARAELRRLRSRDPERFQAVCADHAVLCVEIPGATLGDLAHVQGDGATALRHYRALANAEPERDDGWVGLALTSRQTGTDPGSRLLATRPEWVAAVHREIGRLRAGSPEIAELVEWLARELGHS